MSRRGVGARSAGPSVWRRREGSAVGGGDGGREQDREVTRAACRAKFNKRVAIPCATRQGIWREYKECRWSTVRPLHSALSLLVRPSPKVRCDLWFFLCSSPYLNRARAHRLSSNSQLSPSTTLYSACLARAVASLSLARPPVRQLARVSLVLRRRGCSSLSVVFIGC